jgi:hypothetical protein
MFILLRAGVAQSLWWLDYGWTTVESKFDSLEREQRFYLCHRVQAGWAPCSPGTGVPTLRVKWKGVGMTTSLHLVVSWYIPPLLPTS